MDNKTKIEIHNRVQDFNSYRAARVKSLFNAENGCNFDLEAEIDLSGEWQIGVVVGPSLFNSFDSMEMISSFVILINE